MENQKFYLVLATPKNGSEPYYIYNGVKFTLENAEANCRDCNRYWGIDITYTIVEASN